MSMQDEDDQQDDDTTGALPQGSTDPRSPVSKFGAEAPSFANAPGVGINAPGAQGQGAIPEPQEEGQGPVAGDPGNQMRSPAGQEGDKFQKDWQGVKDVAGQVGTQIKNSPAGQFIMRYLAGADAAPQAAVDQLSQQVDPQGQLTDGQRAVLTVDKAAQTGGEEAAFKVVQNLRQKWNATQGFAYTALNGSPQKPGDLGAAAHAASQAAAHMPDGTEAQFAPNQTGGITATVTVGPGKPQQQINLTAPQFNQYLDIGRVDGGQFDAVYENGGIPAVLQRLSQGQGIPVGPQMGTPNVQATNRTVAGMNASRTGVDQAAAIPASSGIPPTSQQREPGSYSPELEAKSRRIFPSVGESQQRQLWMAKMEQQGEVNATNRIKAETPLGVAGVRAGATTEAATTRAGGQVAAAQAHSQGQVDAAMIRAASTNENARLRVSGVLAQVAANTQNKQAATAAVLLKQKLANVALGQALSPQDEQQILALTTQGAQPAQPPAQVSNAPAAPAAPTTSAPSGAQFKPPAGWQFSAGRQQYRDQSGKVYDINGKPVGP